MTSPRFFVAAPEQTTDSVPLGPEGLVHVLDTFFLQRGAAIDECVVGIDAVGQIAVHVAESRAQLSVACQTELGFHELSAGPARCIHAEALFVLEVSLLEQPSGSAETTDDPVYLYGTLTGPLSDIPSGILTRTPGQLTVTRQHLLEAFVRSAPHAFRSPPIRSAVNGRVYHALVGGDRPDALAAGRGLVLIMPMLPPEETFTDPDNSILVAQMLFDLLSAWAEDITQGGGALPNDFKPLPIPSRAAHEAELAAQGFTIKGDIATRPRSQDPGFSGWVSGIFGPSIERLVLPPEGSIQRYLEIANNLLTANSRGPSLASQALARCVQPTPVRPSVQSSNKPFAVPSNNAAGALHGENTSALPPSPRPHAPYTATSERPGPPEWMRDFMDAHGGGAAKRVTSAPSNAQPRTSAPSNAQPRREADREPQVQRTPPPNPAPKPMPKPANAKPKPVDEQPKPANTKPDWMKDFE